MDVNFLLAELPETVSKFLQLIKQRKVIAFHGEMGTGKTTFIHALCDYLGVTEAVSSPTFSIINEYKASDGSIIYHMDLYRLKNTGEAITAGVEDCLYSGELCLVEWPDNAPGIFPDDTVHCYLKSIGNSKRKLQIKL
jgi:tRNA threonylcarbamoyladenosine biosynthesis protein TsaE